MLSTWQFIGMVFTILLCSSLLIYFLARRIFPKLLTDTMSPAFGVMGTSFGFILGFTIAILWQNYTAGMKYVQDEGTSFNILINNLSPLDPKDQLKLVEGVDDYISVLKKREWPAMSRGTYSPEAWTAYNRLYAIMRSIKPSSHTATSAYSDIYRQLDAIGVSRTARLETMNPMIDVGIRLVIVLGAFFIIYSVAVNDTKNQLNHFVSMIVVCFLLAFNVGISFILAYPYSGTLKIQGKSLLEDIPVRLAHRKERLAGIGIKSDSE
jgi:hypothetical protein